MPDFTGHIAHVRGLELVKGHPEKPNPTHPQICDAANAGTFLIMTGAGLLVHAI